MKLTLVNPQPEGTHVVVNGREGVIVGHEIHLRVRYDEGGHETLDQADVEYHPMYKRDHDKGGA